ncbi:MAG: SDR family oxidoreductase [Deltaproteobacteria bacterium]|nr:SDR family oxidoreductase [Deltaproteobacteria bacterium]
MASRRERVIVVTGASAGVGRAVVRKLGKQGARVGLLARGEDGLEGARRDVEAAGGQALVLPTDVADPEAVRAAAEEVERRLGPIDVWINNAMTAVFARTWEVTPEEFRRVTEVTYLGVVYGTLAALEHMIPRGRGKIVQVGSALAYRGIPLQASYCAAKHAIQGFTESLRCELMHDGIPIGVTMVQLPALNTPQFDWVRSRLPKLPQPVPPIFQPEVAADAIVYATDHDRREIFVGGPTVKAIWGNKLAPWFADRVLASSGVKSQQRDAAQPPDRPDNLFSPLPGDRGAHGAFDDRARGWSAELWVSKHRGLVAAAAGLGVVGLVAALLRRGR